jgi:long-chain fatty acid transport protein
MARRFAIRRLLQVMCTIGVLGLSTQAMASAFQLFEQDGASVGDYHAGRAAQANNASTAFYNPAGMTMIRNQEFVIGDVLILSDIKYSGNVSVNTLNGGAPQSVVAQGGAFSQVPDLFYVAPINDRWSFGFSVVAPFGLKTDYGRNTALRYAATSTELTVIDVSPSLAFNITRKISVGAGFDWQRLGAEFDQDATLFGLTATGTNKAWSTAYGFHVGTLVQVLPTTRIGLAYNSQVVHHVRGSSKLYGPATDFVTGLPFNGGVPTSIVSQYANAHVTLPAYTTLSAFHQLNDRWALMATTIYTQWSVFQNLTLSDIAVVNVNGLGLPVPSNNYVLSLQEGYRNSWNFSGGAEYKATDKATLRGGLGYDESPVKNTNRDIRIPDGGRYAVAFGGHYQATKAFAFDLGWTHLFVIGNQNVTPPPLIVGAQATITNGTVQTAADIFGAQFTWDIV